jgi:hypothetical protein
LTDDDEDDPYDPVILLGSDAAADLLRPGGRKRLLPTIPDNDLPLAETTTNLIDLQKLQQDDPGLSWILGYITDPCKFAEIIQPPDVAPEKRHRPLSRGMQRHSKKLSDYDIVEPITCEEAWWLSSPVGAALMTILVCTVFLVRKKNNTGRLIFDARRVNRRMTRPPPMELPRIHDVIRRILSWESAAQCDGVSYFYQFGLHRDIRPAFRARLAGGRGTINEVQLRRMPMGWTWSPCIAQRVSNHLVRDVGVAWVDNFIIGATTLESFEEKRKTFKERLLRYNVAVDDDTLKPSSDFTALGLHFDLENKRYRLTTNAIEKLQATANTEMCTYREYLVLLGTLVWSDYALAKPLWCRAEALAAMREITKKCGGRYDEPCTWPDYARLDLDRWVSDTIKNEWRSAPAAKGIASFEDLIFSDSSGTECAWLRLKNGTVLEGDQWTRKDNHHIYIGELLALTAGAQRHPKLPFITDNLPLKHTLLKGHSSSYMANCILRDTFGDSWPTTGWVDTLNQLADPYTRGKFFDTFPHPAPPCYKQAISVIK